MAPLSTSILAMSTGFRSSKAPLVAIAPSITINGSFDALIERNPLSIIFELGFTPLLVVFICNPATFPVRADAALVKLFEEIKSPCTF